MARDLKAKIRLTADTKQASKELKTVGTRLTDLGKNVLAPIAGFAALTKAFVSVVANIAETTKAVAQLEQSLKVLGPAAAEVTSGLREQASALSSVTEFSNAEIISVQARISAFTKEEAQIKALSQATLDLAAGRSIGLVEASEAIAKSFGTAGNVLNEYGIVVDAAAGSTARLTQVVDGVAEKWDDAAQGAAATFTTAVNNLTAALVRSAAASSQIIIENDGLSSALVETTKALNAGTLEIEEQETALGKLEIFFQRFAEIFLPATSQGLKDFRAAQAAVNDELRVYGPLVETGAERTARLAKAFGVLNPALGDVGPLLETGAERTARMAKEFGTLNKATRTLNEIFKDFANSLKDVGNGFDGIEIEDTKAQLEALGVTLDGEVNEAIEKNNQLLLKADELYRLGIITRGDFNETQERVAITNAKLNGTFVEQIAAVDGATEATGVYSTALRESLRLLSETDRAELRLTETVVTGSQRRIAARARENAGTQTIFGQQTTQGGTFFIPDTVVAGANGRVEVARHIGPSGRGVSII